MRAAWPPAEAGQTGLLWETDRRGPDSCSCTTAATGSGSENGHPVAVVSVAPGRIGIPLRRLQGDAVGGGAASMGD